MRKKEILGRKKVVRKREKGLSILYWKTELYRRYWFIIDDMR
jgi:hypothetical protein